MTNSASITVTNHRLRKAMSEANDDDLKSHTKKIGEKLKSELKIEMGEIIELYSDTETVKVKINGSTETCLIAHDTFSEGMSIIGFPEGTTKIDHKEHIITPSEKLYGIVATVEDGNKDKKVLLSYVNRKKWNNLPNCRAGEYKIQVGDNYISLDKDKINIHGENLFINGLPYTEAYTPLEDYHNKDEINDLLNSFVDKIYPIGSIYMSLNNTNPSDLFGGTWVQLIDTFLYASSTVDVDATTYTGGEARHTLTVDEMPNHSHREANSTVIYNDSSSNRFATSGTGTKVSLATDLNINTNGTGGGQSHNNMPPYMKVYMWKRTK